MVPAERREGSGTTPPARGDIAVVIGISLARFMADWWLRVGNFSADRRDAWRKRLARWTSL
jgi:hypothetical protein